MAKPKIKVSKEYIVCPDCDELVEYKSSDVIIFCEACKFKFRVVDGETIPIETDDLESLEELIAEEANDEEEESDESN